MGIETNVALAKALLERLSDGGDPDEVASLFSEELIFDIQVDEGALPWIGRKVGRAAIANFVRNVRAMTDPVAFDVEDILASEDRAVIVGSLRTRIRATGKITSTQFAKILSIDAGVVRRFQMLEDSFDVSNAARRHQDARSGKA